MIQPVECGEYLVAIVVDDVVWNVFHCAY
jgi:hypothetical protein